MTSLRDRLFNALDAVPRAVARWAKRHDRPAVYALAGGAHNAIASRRP